MNNNDKLIEETKKIQERLEEIQKILKASEPAGEAPSIIITSRYDKNKQVLVSTAKTLKEAVEIAVKDKANLSGAYLYGADLSGADLSGANLSEAYLYGANLSKANLSKANLSGAYLSGAYLSGADLSGADLSGADLSGANLKNVRVLGKRFNLSHPT